MQDIFSDLQAWLSRGEPFALATVTRTWGSAPRPVGSAMAVTADLQVLGSVSGGCIEGEVIEAARTVLRTAKPQLLEFGVSDETAWSVGLSCGGTIGVLVEKHPAFLDDAASREAWEALNIALLHHQPAVLLTKLDPANPAHLLVYPDGKTLGEGGHFPEHALQAALDAYENRGSVQTEIDGEEIFVQVFPRRERLLIVGAGHIAIPLLKFAKELNFETVLVDPRKVFAAPERFPSAPDQVYEQWPGDVLPSLELDRDTFAVLITHDPKIDDPALHLLLRSEVAYIGALGSRKTHAKRCERLREAGFTESEIARIQGPVGLDIGARSPAEIALSIMGQVVQIKRGSEK